MKSRSYESITEVEFSAIVRGADKVTDKQNKELTASYVYGTQLVIFGNLLYQLFLYLFFTFNEIFL